MYNTILQTSLLLFGNDIKTIRFEANMLRSLGIKSIRGIVDIESYLRRKTLYPMIDAFLIHEHCTPYTGVEFIERLRLEHKSTTPMILILSSPPSALLMQDLESLSSVALVRPYTRRDVQRALVQSKRIITEHSAIEASYYKRVEQEMQGEGHREEATIGQSNDFLISMIHFQFFLRSGDYEKASEKLLLIRSSMSEEQIFSLIERTAKERDDPTACIQCLCDALSYKNKEFSQRIGIQLIEGYEHRSTIKKLSERKARVIAEGEIRSMWKYVQ